MKALSTFDLYLWDFYMPGLNEKSFKNKLLCIMALAYISFYKLPRKFLMNYFKGNGQGMVIDSEQMIMCNSVVLDKLTEAISTFKIHGITKGSFDVSQTDVHDPNYKYSVGSFCLNYAIHHESVEITIHSIYHFQHNPNRLTKHLHTWLYSKTIKGTAQSFNVKSFPLVKSFSEINHARINHYYRKIPNNVVLV